MSELCSLGMILIIVSFLGFLTENFWLFFTKGFVDNRNMHLPFLIGYGMAVITMYFCFGTPDEFILFGYHFNFANRAFNYSCFYICAVLSVSIGEIALGTFVEKTCHIYWWDYSKRPLHITRYTSVFTSMGFGLLISIFMDKFFVPIFNYFCTLNLYGFIPVTAILLIALTVDYVISIRKMWRNKSTNQIWVIRRKHFHLHQFEQQKLNSTYTKESEQRS